MTENVSETKKQQKDVENNMDWKCAQEGIFKVIENKKSKLILRISKKHLTTFGHIMWKKWRVIIVHNL